MDIKIKSISIVLTHGTDRVYVKTDLPCPYSLAGQREQAPLQLDFDATYDTGAEYCRKVFGIEPTVINGRKG
jgi:hypothetical protein